MGLLRLLLALAVVIEHSTPVLGYHSVGGMAAVQLFFMISGFYMTLILNEKYTGPGAYALFVTNRALRIYPIYWVVALAALSLSAVTWLAFDKPVGALGYYAAHWDLMGWWNLPVLAFANLTLLAQDWILFFGIDPLTGGWIASPDFKLDDPPIHAFILVRPAWTLGLEMTFYLIAPFVVRRGLAFLLGLIAASLALRVWMFHGLGLDHDPWTERFFPTELALFLMGGVGWHLYRTDAVRTLLGLAGARTIVALFVAALLLFEFLPDGHLKHWAVYALAVPAIPTLFAMTRDWPLDRWIGELSYPVYICHVLLIVVSGQVLERLGLEAWGGAVAIPLSLAAAVLLNHFVAEPIERIRAGRVVRAGFSPALPVVELRPA